MTPNISIQALPPMVIDAVTGPGASRILMRRCDNEAAYVLVLVHGTKVEEMGVTR